jgi:hypothetical protein
VTPGAARRWDLGAVADAAATALEREAFRLDAEQSPRGLDAPAELGLHPIIERGLASAGFGIHREVRYPSGAETRKRSAGDRCDFVLTPCPAEPLEDPEGAFTLYAGSGFPPSEALWIEVKTVRQFALVKGIASENPGYAARLWGPAMKDLDKLASDDLLGPAASLIVLFAASEEVARHDLEVWAHRALDRGRPIEPPRLRGFAITDRLGNAWCAVALTRVLSGR